MKYFLGSSVLAAALCVAVPQFSIAAPAMAAAAGDQAADEALSAKVKGQIDSTADFAGSDVAVSAVGGTVTLRGTAPTAVVRLKIVEMTQSTEGVTKVVNKVNIKAKK